MRKWRKVWLIKRQRKRGSSYALRWYDENGDMRSEGVGPDRKLAESLRRRREYEINSPDHVEVQRIASDKFAAEFLISERGKVAESTLKQVDIVLRHFFGQIGVKYLCDVRIKHVEDYRTQRLQEGRSPHTVNKEVRHLKAIFNKALKLGYLSKNPCEGLRHLPAPIKQIRVLSHEEVRALFAEVSQDLRWSLLLRLLVETGARIGEILALEFSNINLDQGVVSISPKEGWTPKSRKARLVYISKKTCELLCEYKKTTMWSYVFTTRSGAQQQDVYHQFKRIVKRAGIRDCTLHDLRRTVISQLAELGINQVVTQQLAGHYSMDTTVKFYTSIANQAVRRAVERLPWWGQE